MNQFAIGGVEARPQARDTHPSHDGGRTAMVPATVGIDARQSRTGNRPDGSFMSTWRNKTQADETYQKTVLKASIYSESLSLHERAVCGGKNDDPTALVRSASYAVQTEQEIVNLG